MSPTNWRRKALTPKHFSQRGRHLDWRVFRPEEVQLSSPPHVLRRYPARLDDASGEGPESFWRWRCSKTGATARWRSQGQWRQGYAEKTEVPAEEEIRHGGQKDPLFEKA